MINAQLASVAVDRSHNAGETCWRMPLMPTMWIHGTGVWGARFVWYEVTTSRSSLSTKLNSFRRLLGTLGLDCLHLLNWIFFSDFFRSPTIFTLAASSWKRNVTIWRPFVCSSVCLSHRHTHRDSPRGSMQRGQRTFWPEKKDRHTCLVFR